MGERTVLKQIVGKFSPQVAAVLQSEDGVGRGERDGGGVGGSRCQQKSGEMVSQGCHCPCHRRNSRDWVSSSAAISLDGGFFAWFILPSIVFLAFCVLSSDSEWS